MKAIEKQIMIYLAICSVIFLLIAVICIAFIFAPVKEYVEDNSGEITVISWGSLDINGAGIIARTWQEKPNYIIGLGVAAFLSFSGAIVSIYMIDKFKKEIKEIPDL